jgi:hypothetical protein
MAAIGPLPVTAAENLARQWVAMWGGPDAAAVPRNPLLVTQSRSPLG